MVHLISPNEETTDNRRIQMSPFDGKAMRKTSIEAQQTLSTMMLPSKTHAEPDQEPRPIIVGYAFGPKKMSSMGVVMAEASMAVSTVVTDVPLASSEKIQQKEEQSLKRPPPMSDSPRKEPRIDAASPIGTTIQRKSRDYNDERAEMVTLNEDDSSFMSSMVSKGIDQEVASIASTGDGMNNNGVVHIYLGKAFVKENASSDSICQIMASPSTTSSNASSSEVNISGMKTPTSTSSPTKTTSNLTSVRVSFVPLDLDSPLEEQHGGNFDAILHKMTEDILYMSQSSLSADVTSASNPEPPSIVPHTINSSSTTKKEQNEQQIVERIQRLARYKINHPSCCLLDHPTRVQAVMSRSDIALVLSNCLKGVSSTSGIPAGTPRFLVLNGNEDDAMTNVIDNTDLNTTTEMSTKMMNATVKQIEEKSLSYPLIAKPLTAAGTTESHKMAVVLGRKGMQKVHYPCILQEYANHDGLLYKVYVLGSKVWVFPRTSLPNLPLGECSLDAIAEDQVLEFDSQKPYPKLADFCSSSNASSHAESEEKVSIEMDIDQEEVTAEEIQPIADCLRRAFELELFGFDVIVAKKKSNNCGTEKNEREMLVIDVNYFPSYREVEKFSEQLAQYLAQCAIEGRVRSFESEI